jgi:hypothetical protein
VDTGERYLDLLENQLCSNEQFLGYRHKDDHDEGKWMAQAREDYLTKKREVERKKAQEAQRTEGRA